MKFGFNFFGIIKDKRNQFLKTKPKSVSQLSGNKERNGFNHSEDNGIKISDKQNTKMSSKTQENSFVYKTSKAETTGKVLNGEKNKKIELVGDYFQKNGNNKTKSGSKDNPKTKVFRNSLILREREEKDERNKRKSEESQQNLILIEKVVENRLKISKTEEILLKSGNRLERLPSDSTVEEKTESDVKLPVKSQNIDVSGDSVFSEDFFESNINVNSIDGNDVNPDSRPVGAISGIVPIRDIDLKTTKCVLCLHLVSNQIAITVCSHIFCTQCLHRWIIYSQHCPQCREFISSFAHSLKVGPNDRLCIRSENDYKVVRIVKNSNKLIDSLSSALLFDAFLLNRLNTTYFESKIKKICEKISELESNLLTSVDVQQNVVINYRINEEKHRLEEFTQKRIKSEDNFRFFGYETHPKMIEFWTQLKTSRDQLSEE